MPSKTNAVHRRLETWPIRPSQIRSSTYIYCITINRNIRTIIRWAFRLAILEFANVLWDKVISSCLTTEFCALVSPDTPRPSRIILSWLGMLVNASVPWEEPEGDRWTRCGHDQAGKAALYEVLAWAGSLACGSKTSHLLVGQSIIHSVSFWRLVAFTDHWCGFIVKRRKEGRWSSWHTLASITNSRDMPPTLPQYLSGGAPRNPLPIKLRWLFSFNGAAPARETSAFQPCYFYCRLTLRNSALPPSRNESGRSNPF